MRTPVLFRLLFCFFVATICVGSVYALFNIGAFLFERVAKEIWLIIGTLTLILFIFVSWGSSDNEK